MSDTISRIDLDVALIAPLRAYGRVERITAALLRSLLESGMTVSAVDSTGTAVRGAFRRTASAEIIQLLRSPRVQLAAPGHIGQVQLAVVVVSRASKPMTQLRSGAHAATALIVAGDLAREDQDGTGTSEVEHPGSEQPQDDPSSEASTPVADRPWQIVEQVQTATQARTLRWASFAARDLPDPDEAGLALVESTTWPAGVRDSAISTTARVVRPEALPRVGRHMTALEPTWPKDRRVILRHLPNNDRWDVRLFGAHARLKRQVETVPENWNLSTVAGPRDLNGLDYWVAVTQDPAQILGDSAVHDALAAGLVVILPPDDELHSVFGDAVVFADAVGVRGQISHLHQHPELYSAQSERALRWAQANSSAVVEQRLADAGLAHPMAPPPPAAPKPVPRAGRRRFRLALVTSNGAGMGHLTRLLAIARRLPENIEPVFISLSQAVDVVATFGYPYAYIASKSETGLSASQWNTYCEARFTEELARLSPDALVFDGTWPYRGLTAAAHQTETPMIWSRRGMWREAAGDRSLAHSTLFDLILEPGEFAAAADTGATTRVDDAHSVEPVTVLSREELLPQSQARERLGISDEVKAVLVTLGAGNLNDINTTTTDVISALKEHLPHWRIFLTSNPLSMADSSYSGVESVQIYPIAEYANAFDLTVSAAGYNSFHEWISAGVPTLWMPNTSTQTDDQVARARYAEQTGVGICLEDPDREAIFRAVERLAVPEAIEQMRRRLEERTSDNGAGAAAQLIARLITEGQDTDD